jgi:hypothetical protein
VNGSTAWIFDFLRTMAPLAIRGGGFFTEEGFHSCFGMAAGTNHVISERGIRSIVFELMTEGAISPESRARVYTRMRVHVLCVGKIDQDRPDVLVAGKWQ